MPRAGPGLEARSGSGRERVLLASVFWAGGGSWAEGREEGGDWRGRTWGSWDAHLGLESLVRFSTSHREIAATDQGAHSPLL